jgi:hypothetical protein
MLPWWQNANGTALRRIFDGNMTFAHQSSEWLGKTDEA